MAFIPKAFNVIVQPVGGDGLRFVSYRTDDAAEVVTGAGYFVGVAAFGAKEHDLVFVTPLTGPGDPYIVVMVEIDADGDGTAELSLSDTALQPSDIGVTVQGWRAGLDAITSYGFTLTAAEDAAGARTALELGTAATQASSAFATAAQGTKADTALQPAAIGVTVASQANGALAATALQPAAIGSTVQAYDTDLAAIAALTSAADRVPYATGAGAWSLATLTSFARQILDDADAGAVRTTIGAQQSDGLLTALAALTTAAGGFIRTTGVDTVAAQAIVGTVSQSGGTPTGALFETGSNANGGWIRLPMGLQVCWHELTTSEAITTASGSLFFQAADTTWTYPIEFSNAPVVLPIALRSDRAVGAQLSSNPTTTTAAIRAWSAVSLGAIGPIRCFAVGRWF